MLRRIHSWKLLASAAAISALMAGCQSTMDKKTTAKETEVKNVIMMIGDGMGPQQIGLLHEYAINAPDSIYHGQLTGMQKFMDAGVIGLSRHTPAYNLVVDSACSATQLATGEPAPSEVIGVDKVGNHVETVLEKAKRMGKSTGLVSDTRLTHATPASFAAHRAHRSMENQIAEDMLADEVDVMLSGGLRHWLPKSVNDKGELYQQLEKKTEGAVQLKSKRKDDKNLLAEAENKGYQLAFNRHQLDAAKGDKLLGLFNYSGMMNGIRYTHTKDDPKRTEPSLKEMTMKALDILSRNEKGFFLMIEGGQIDWAGHDNDAGTMLHEMLKFDETINYVYEWVKNRQDTLVIITADHETGGFGFSYSRSNIPEGEKLTGEAFKEAAYAPNFNFGSFETLSKLYQQKMSFPDLFAQFDGGKPSPEALMKLVNANSAFPITLEQAKAVLEQEPNYYQVDGHDYLSAKMFPKVNDFKSFYVYGQEVRHDLLGRAMSESQNVVWATGTHTSTPVPVMAFGPASATEGFSKLLHHTDIGKLAKSAIH
ncbi:alkaline phosphatase [Hahella sp. NBU794]|uniref:alkaline phosphatase n=1 Tax=Hahella sp. NBU794 TaxID=3422590 RepID=UPI003D6DE071